MRKLRDVIPLISSSSNICLGARSGYIYIAPKDEMMWWLYQKDNLELWSREVVSCEWNDIPHHGYIIKIKGDEQSTYYLRSEITGKKSPRTKITNVEAAIKLCGSVISEIVADIAREEAFAEYYGSTNLSYEGYLIFKTLKKAGDEARQFLNDKRTLSQWIPSKESVAKKLIDQKKKIIIQDYDRKVVTFYMIKKIRNHYTKAQGETIEDMIIAGESSEDILKKVGTGKDGAITKKDIDDFKDKFEAARKLERRKYLRQLNLDPQKPFKEQMTVSPEKMESLYIDMSTHNLYKNKPKKLPSIHTPYNYQKFQRKEEPNDN